MNLTQKPRLTTFYHYMNELSVCVPVCLSVCAPISVCVCLCASISDTSPIHEFTASTSSSIHCLCFSPTDNNVYVVLHSGHMVVCTAAVTSSRSPVRTECHGNGRPIHCIAVRTLDTGYVTLQTNLLFLLSHPTSARYHRSS